MQRYYAAIQNKVCRECKFGFYGENEQFFFCDLPEKRQCAIRRFLPEIVEIVESIQAPTYQNQIVELRCKVCFKCDQFNSGMCPLTGAGSCTLEDFFIQVVEAIREAKTLPV